jgi:hypothetical protein
MLSFTKIYFKGTLRQVFICLRPPPLLATHCHYILYFDTGKGGGGELERRLEGQ